MSVIEFALTIAIGFGFLARRYGTAVGLIMAGSLLLMPRLYGQAHLIDTDIPGLFLWAATVLAFWNGLHEEKGRHWRVLAGVLLGLAFVEKMAAVGVLLPLSALARCRTPDSHLARPGSWADWIDGLVTSGLMLLPLVLAFQEIEGLQRQLPLPPQTNLFVHRPSSDLPGVILIAPLCNLVSQAVAGPDLSREQALGCGAASARDLDGHPRLRAGRGLAWQPGLAARNTAPTGPLLHAER